jgi:maltose alpha-D-glucosyltransferase / alpha-amylase
MCRYGLEGPTAAGLRRRLDYLEGLGVDVIWLATSQPSPNRDDGYDVADYYGSDPRLPSTDSR